MSDRRRDRFNLPAPRRAIKREGLTLSVSATLGVNFTLNAGQVEAIQVQAVAPDIQTEKADISAVVDRKKIVDLPLVGRNVLSLAALQPGINGVRTTADFLVREQGMGVTANGVRETGNNAMVDGASINNGPWGGTMIVVPNVEAVQEFQVTVDNLDDARVTRLTNRKPRAKRAFGEGWRGRRKSNPRPPA